MSAFSPSGSSATSSSSFPSASSPTAANLALSLAATEYSFTFPTGTKKFRVQLTGVATLKVRYSTGGPDWTVGAGSVLEETALLLASPLTVYFVSSLASQNLELTYWT